MSRVWAVALVLVLVGCVSIAPIPTASPRGTDPAPTATAAEPTRPIQTSSPASTPGAPPSLGATATPGLPGTPGPSIDPALAQQIDAVIAEVPLVRQLEPLAPVPYEFITREQFRDDLIELQFEEVPEERLRAEERLLKRLGLLPDDADLLQLLVDLYGGGVAAFYRPDTKRFYIIQRDQPFGPGDRIIVAHEYTHALQDQHFDLDGTRVKDLSEGDAALGQLAAIEGDATLTMQLWMFENLTLQEQLEAYFDSLGQLGDPLLASMPPILRRQLMFPYEDGFAFTQRLHRAGGFGAVDATLSTAVPASTEQVLHPEKYLANEAPVDVTLPDLAPVLGDGWQVSYEQTLGELLMQVWVAADEAPVPVPGIPATWPYKETVAGWGGDRLNMYEHPDGRWAVAWRIVWDTESDALEFRERASELAPTMDPAAVLTDTGDNSTVIITASDVSIVNLLTNDLDWTP